jgi:hypothetical protein
MGMKEPFFLWGARIDNKKKNMNLPLVPPHMQLCVESPTLTLCYFEPHPHQQKSPVARKRKMAFGKKTID